MSMDEAARRVHGRLSHQGLRKVSAVRGDQMAVASFVTSQVERRNSLLNAWQKHPFTSSIDCSPCLMVHGEGHLHATGEDSTTLR